MGFTGRPSTVGQWYNMREAAKILGTGRTRLYEKLRNLEIIDEDNNIIHFYLELNLFKVHVEQIPGHHRMNNYNMILTSQKGLEFLSDLLDKIGNV